MNTETLLNSGQFQPVIAGWRPLSFDQRQHLGQEAAEAALFRQDKVWSRYSNDKVDIAHTLAHVIRALHRALPPRKPLTALSVGSSNEPQFRILESAFQGGLYLLDIESAALEVVEERTRRQRTTHVRTLRGDYRSQFADPGSTRQFRLDFLDGRRMSLITLHHSLYYSPECGWRPIVANLTREILAPNGGAIHAVMMACRSRDTASTTWLYNHFSGRFFGHRNDQDLRRFGRGLQDDRQFANIRIERETRRVEFFVEDFQLFMGVVWMILLHPLVHQFSTSQQEEVIEHIYGQFWLPRRPLVQVQDHLVLYRGLAV